MNSRSKSPVHFEKYKLRQTKTTQIKNRYIIKKRKVNIAPPCYVHGERARQSYVLVLYTALNKTGRESVVYIIIVASDTRPDERVKEGTNDGGGGGCARRVECKAIKHG